MKYITIPTIKGNCSAYDIIEKSGFTRQESDDPRILHRFISLDAKCNPFNHFHKDGRIYVFDGWEENEYGLMADNPRFITLLDITELVKELATC